MKRKVSHALRFQNCAGVSLLELIVVLALMAFLATGAAVSFRSAIQNAKLETALSAIKSLDRRIRYSAIQKNETNYLLLNLSSDEFSTIEKDRPEIRLPTGISISKVFISREQVQSNQLSISYAPDGSSLSWALGITDSEITKWMVFSGRTGQATVMEQENEASKIFDMLSRRSDTN